MIREVLKTFGQIDQLRHRTKGTKRYVEAYLFPIEQEVLDTDNFHLCILLAVSFFLSVAGF